MQKSDESNYFLMSRIGSVPNVVLPTLEEISGAQTLDVKRRDLVITGDDIRNRFTYHKPTGNQPMKYETIRSMAANLATLIIEATPDSREQALAITKLEETVFWANAAIARHE